MFIKYFIFPYKCKTAANSSKLILQMKISIEAGRGRASAPEL